MVRPKWPATYDLIKKKLVSLVMLIRFDNTEIPGLYSLAGSVDAQKTTALGAAKLVLERLAINEGIDRNTYGVQLVMPESPDSGQLIDSTQKLLALERSFIACRIDRNPVARRNVLEDISKTLSKISDKRFQANVLAVNVSRQLLLVARTYGEFRRCIARIQRAMETLLSGRLTWLERGQAMDIFVEWAVDYSQIAKMDSGVHEIVALLNDAIDHLGHEIGVGSQVTADDSRLSHLLRMRAKCRRALASFYRRRTFVGSTTDKRANKLRADALADANRAFGAENSGDSALELALCLFANSSTADSENAQQAMGLVERASNEGNVLATYELAKQLRMRHRYLDAIATFITTSETDRDRRRFHSNITHFAAAVIGMFYERRPSDEFSNFAVLAEEWLAEAIAAGNYDARLVVDLNYLRAIRGADANQCAKELSAIAPPDSDGMWNDLARIPQNADGHQESLSDGLLLGLEDAVIWSRIGTFFFDFLGDYQMSNRYYDRAIKLDTFAPAFYLNKARALIRMGDKSGAQSSLDRARYLSNRHRGWYRANENQFVQVDSEIQS